MTGNMESSSCCCCCSSGPSCLDSCILSGGVMEMPSRGETQRRSWDTHRPFRPGTRPCPPGGAVLVAWTRVKAKKKKQNFPQMNSRDALTSPAHSRLVPTLQHLFLLPQARKTRAFSVELEAPIANVDEPSKLMGLLPSRLDVSIFALVASLICFLVPFPGPSSFPWVVWDMWPIGWIWYWSTVRVVECSQVKQLLGGVHSSLSSHCCCHSNF